MADMLNFDIIKKQHAMVSLVQNAQDWITTMDKTGLDWEVEKLPLTVMGNCDGFYQSDIPSFGIFRMENEGNGERIFVSARMPYDFDVAGLGDKHYTYLLFVNSHDGSMAVNVFLIVVRVVCNNTLSIRQQQALRAKGSLKASLEKLNGLMEKTSFVKVLDNVFPAPDKSQTRQQNLCAIVARGTEYILDIEHTPDGEVLAYYRELAEEVEHAQASATGTVFALKPREQTRCTAASSH